VETLKRNSGWVEGEERTETARENLKPVNKELAPVHRGLFETPAELSRAQSEA